ncbi:trypsin-like serine peptidase [Pelagovum pacificum]|uniref:Trypsin-like serine protease n=1 Tax=Pelagovum pacificum TaxID=2588711 RepID=A0A5C5GHN0_9RHOB|nr:trypsin-like peptidase domain-containing protein [Pelagovum pacificum]QQA43463.1 trypsin-like peptidase domain-containing protein [Pelagovum pacificum]TNY33401.1 trypsin-like serine protease [Pelagovum pacificum]
MRFRLAALLCLVASLATAQETDLLALRTLDAARGYEAVGRIEIDGRGFCTGALIEEDLVLTAAHCLYDQDNGERIDPTKLEFLAGLRDGRALAYRGVRRAIHPDSYVYSGTATLDNVALDIALLELDQPIRSTQIVPFDLGAEPRIGEPVSVVSYALDRAEAPSLQETCDVMGSQDRILVMTCNVDFGSSGAPVFSIAGGAPRIVSVVSAKAQVDEGRVALGMAIDQPLRALRTSLLSGGGDYGGVEQSRIRVIRPGEADGSDTGAKFLRP